MWISDQWKDYELIDASDGQRLERWGDYILIRPDPQVIWKGMRTSPLWKKADASYSRSRQGGGQWNENRLPEQWEIGYGDLRFKIKPMGFKHTGLFPEQAVNWDFASEMIRNAGREVRVLNLFAYTGGATVAAAKAGASVCHVDAAKGIVAHARENAALCGLSDAPIRWIVDDCAKFVAREVKRGSRYDAVIMDPPSYGRGPGGEVWKLEDCVGDFISMVTSVLSDDPLFVIINSYTTGLSPSVMSYMLDLAMRKRFGGSVECAELGLPVSSTKMPLPCGSTARWKK